MDDRFRDYDVLAKRDTLSWNEPTRRALDERRAMVPREGVLDDALMATLRAVVARICPDPPGREATTTLAMLVDKIATDAREGYRHHRLPGTAECWRRGLAGLEAEARARYDMPFAALAPADADLLLADVARGDVRSEAWADMPPELFWQWRLLPDLVSAHWAQPSLWSAMGFGGPASPRGYVRLDANLRDPWEAIEHGDRPRFGWPRRHGG